MAGIDDKITNGLFVWGSSTSGSSDLASVTIGGNGVVPGSQGGTLIYSDLLNSGIRTGSLVTYALIEALKKGPITTAPSINTYAGTNWYDDLSPMSFDYETEDVNIGTFSTNLQTVINQYLKYSTVYHAARANVWDVARKFVIVNYDGSYPVYPLDIDGSTTNQINGQYQLKLPSTIKSELFMGNLQGDVMGTASNAVMDNLGNTIIQHYASNLSMFESNGCYILTLLNKETSPQPIGSMITFEKTHVIRSADIGLNKVYFTFVPTEVDATSATKLQILNSTPYLYADPLKGEFHVKGDTSDNLGKIAFHNSTNSRYVEMMNDTNGSYTGLTLLDHYNGDTNTVGIKLSNKSHDGTHGYIPVLDIKNSISGFKGVLGFNGDVIPLTSGQGSIGTSGKKWKEVYANNFYGTASKATNADNTSFTNNNYKTIDIINGTTIVNFNGTTYQEGAVKTSDFNDNVMLYMKASIVIDTTLVMNIGVIKMPALINFGGDYTLTTTINTPLFTLYDSNNQIHENCYIQITRSYDSAGSLANSSKLTFRILQQNGSTSSLVSINMFLSFKNIN